MTSAPGLVLAVLIDCTVAGACADWRPIDDGVMGGVSRSRLEATADGVAFTGSVSLDYGGGFASVRSAPTRWATAGARAVHLRVRGDGKRYKLTIRTDANFDGVQYQASFETRAGEWQEVVLPVHSFVPSFRGRRVPGAPPLDPAGIRTFGLMISEKQAGPFRLELARLAVDVPAN
ncbi:MAG: CIA30 family protein [Steroidobacteraceae bacterium]|nr:CIA30 family protein [Steroidobacteraceae bacterium]